MALDGGHPAVRLRACVLMSLYNGERYIAEQLASIAAQQDVEVYVLARDDGSTDRSRQVFQDCAEQLGLSHSLVACANVGAANSFFKLIDAAPGSYDLYALADQDDVWLPQKLARAAAALAGAADRPALYFCSQVVVDERLDILLQSKPFRRVGLGNALIQNVVQGAAAVVNERGLALLRSLGMPRAVVMHDWWLYLVFAALGELIYDPWHGLFYRQHAVNVVGSPVSWRRRWLGRARRYVAARPTMLRAQARELRERAGHRLTREDAALLDEFIGMEGAVRSRLRLALGRRVWRQAWHDGFIWRAMMIVGRV